MNNRETVKRWGKGFTGEHVKGAHARPFFYEKKRKLTCLRFFSELVYAL
ncbi:hypothetical protein B4168_2163 [Anoxybacillus flavithermus]|nr:hypothetical protein B4168_2163 [Anoxybacillus flavithermus]OAO85819.1 hypothetical protein GT23_2722 [Parageobacillus thermoglucosidasius]